MRQASIVVVIVAALSCSWTAHAITIATVPIGNPGNAADTRWSNNFNAPIVVGSVDHVYRIAKYEVTASQYTAFLNAVAKADPNGLYNPAMADPGTSNGANIQRTGSSPNYSYTVAADWGNRPVNYVSFWDAARFANWLHNNQPTGAQGPATTEDGSYHDVGNQSLFGRNAGAKSFIPTEDEWYKAAYHKNDGVTGNYWNYPTGSNTEPVNTLPDPGNHANFYDFDGTGNSGYTIGNPYYRTSVGAFLNSASPYGTFDQGGNVWEWNESVVNFASNRGMRGASFAAAGGMHASSQGQSEPEFESPLIGFRIASLNLTGDYNGNGVVDAADYVVWRHSNGSTADYNLWRAHFGEFLPGGTAASITTVPEPATLRVLLLAATVVLFLRTRSHVRQFFPIAASPWQELTPMAFIR